MVGITLLVDLWRKNQQSFNKAHTNPSSWLFSTSATAASISAGASFASNDFFGFRTPVAYCDAGVATADEHLPGVRTSPGKYFYHDSLKYGVKTYNFELKPLWSAFELRSFGLISLRSFLMFYLPLLEPHAKMEQDHHDLFLDNHDELRSKLTVPFKKSVLQIVREVTVVTTRRILERITFHYGSRKMAWRLIKDVPTSAARKAGRKMPTYIYFFSVSKATCRGNMLGIAASWIVQVGVRIFQFFATKSRNEDGSINKAERNRIFKQKVFLATLRCNASLIFASIGGGIGATLIRPSIGQWIGNMLGMAASWIVQVGVRIFQFFATKSRNEDGSINKAERNRIFKHKVFLATLRCNASLIFASIGGGIGATLIRPSIGQWIGCTVGDLTGPVIVAVFANRVLHRDL